MREIRLFELTEADLDKVLVAAGGNRLATDDGGHMPLNADYRLNEAIVELKLILEEGLEKKERQRKVASLYRELQPKRRVIVVDPARLGEGARRRYFNEMERPIQRAIKKAAKQVEATRVRVGEDLTRVVMLLNVGYTALCMEEFKAVALKCARNDTRKVDWVIAGGLYHYGDGMESYVLAPLEACPVNVGRLFPSWDPLLRCWNDLVTNMMTELMRGTIQRPLEKMRVVDLVYEVEGVRYVKPAPGMGDVSQFWRSGRPREDSTGMTRCPPVASTFPDLDEHVWAEFARTEACRSTLRDSYQAYSDVRERFVADRGDGLRPHVLVPVSVDEVAGWCRAEGRVLDGECIEQFALDKFEAKVRDVLDNARERATCRLVVTKYVHVVTEEIGQDRANDVSAIYAVVEDVNGTRREPLIENASMFLEHALCVASAYAVQRGLEVVLFERDQTYAWS